MSEYQRFVTYINRYEGNSKINNVGFAKIESRGEQCKIEIHMKGTGYTGISCPVYLFVREKNGMSGILIGKMQIMNGGSEGRFFINGTNINQTGYALDQIGGFLLPTSGDVTFASLWDEGGWNREEFAPLESDKKEEYAVQAAEAAAQRQPQVLLRQQAPSQSPQQVQPQHREEPWEVKWQFILETYPVLTPFEGMEDALCVRLDLKDLRLLPRRYWYLGNNSFLLHGFFNYRYLILGAMEQEGKKRWFIGVPGVFQSQEKVMAAIFGFPEYESEKIAEQKTGQFGYWYRFLE